MNYRSTYEGKKESLLLFMRLLSKDAQKQISEVILATDDSDNTVAEKMFRINNMVYMNLWELPDAVDRGFHQFMIQEYEKMENILSYHDLNCTGNCTICNDLEHQKQFLESQRN